MVRLPFGRKLIAESRLPDAVATASGGGMDDVAQRDDGQSGPDNACGEHQKEDAGNVRGR
jgi:hypothetical protein